MSNVEGPNSIGVVLAGGLSRRMDGPEKSLLKLSDKPLIQHVCERLEEQVEQVIINANGDASRFSFMANPVQADIIEGYAGPLAGVVSAMHWAHENSPNAKHVVTAAADTPFFPNDLKMRFDAELKSLSNEDQDNTICMAYSDGNRHPVFACWPEALFAPLRAFLEEENERKVMLFAQRYNLVKVDFELIDRDGGTIDPFFNINTPQDFAKAKQHLGAEI